MQRKSVNVIWVLQEVGSKLKRLGNCDNASQIVELAIALPFLMVLLVGIFDFGNAFNTKQKVNTAALQAARFASNQTTLDWSNANAPTALAARDIVSEYLVNGHLPDCGLLTATPTYDDSTHTWTFTANSGCPTNLSLAIQRANIFLMSNGTNVVSTKVTLTYPFQWHFGSVVKLLFPGANYPGPVFTITSNAVMANLS